MRHPPSSPGNGRGGPGGAELTRGRKVSAEDLQLILLALLELNPSHGYELIKAVGALSNAYYTPSPGMVYPALTYLEELGHVTVEPQGSKKRYHLAPQGLAYLTAHRAHAELLLEKLRHIGRKMEWMRQAWSAEPRETGPQGEDLATGWLPEFVETRQALRHALLRKSGASPAEQRRVAAILRRATQEIENTPCS
ncbi:PadR family transcriptional regulator [Bordetella genomosp. 12]|uniref:PadR family transcriptional regulator n=1 Tax=Bordetella genomosp. 12 TaxID=463035 RepID=A0A261VNH3_9BORD|nr:PadR family transcriptional regulator [Bordetella genomosp. 12]OZI75120.1 PadR family transcriptional regulator [Bordetella genomosp. 12]